MKKACSFILCLLTMLLLGLPAQAEESYPIPAYELREVEPGVYAPFIDTYAELGHLEKEILAAASGVWEKEELDGSAAYVDWDTAAWQSMQLHNLTMFKMEIRDIQKTMAAASVEGWRCNIWCRIPGEETAVKVRVEQTANGYAAGGRQKDMSAHFDPSEYGNVGIFWTDVTYLFELPYSYEGQFADHTFMGLRCDAQGKLTEVQGQGAYSDLYNKWKAENKYPRLGYFYLGEWTSYLIDFAVFILLPLLIVWAVRRYRHNVKVK